MKITIGNGSPIDLSDGYATVSGGCVIGLNRYKCQGADPYTYVIEVAYKLQPGETVRRTPEGDYTVGI